MRESVSSALATLRSSPPPVRLGTRARIARTHSAACLDPSAEPKSNRDAARSIAKASGSTARSTIARNGVGPLGQEEVAGVEVLGQGQDADVDLVAQEQFERAVGGLLAGLVAVEDQDRRGRPAGGGP